MSNYQPPYIIACLWTLAALVVASGVIVCASTYKADFTLAMVYFATGCGTAVLLAAFAQAVDLLARIRHNLVWMGQMIEKGAVSNPAAKGE